MRRRLPALQSCCRLSVSDRAAAPLDAECAGVQLCDCLLPISTSWHVRAYSISIACVQRALIPVSCSFAAAEPEEAEVGTVDAGERDIKDEEKQAEAPSVATSALHTDGTRNAGEEEGKEGNGEDEDDEEEGEAGEEEEVVKC